MARRSRWQDEAVGVDEVIKQGKVIRAGEGKVIRKESGFGKARLLGEQVG